MIIIHFISSLGYGGAEKFCLDLAEATSHAMKSGQVYVVSLYGYNERIMLPIGKIDNNVKLIFLNKKRGFDAKILWKIHRLIKQLRPDIINTHLNTLFYVGIIRFFHRRARCFHTVHNLAQNEIGTIFRIFYRYLFNKKLVTPISISKEVMESVKKTYGKRFDLSIVNGTKPSLTTERLPEVKHELDILRQDKNSKIFLNIARVNPQKNQISLVRVFKRFPNCKLLIIGSYDSNNENKILYEDLINRKSENIFFLGIKENIGDYLAVADFFILSSVYEGLPITLLEAFSAGVPCICTAVGGIKDVISDGINGILAKTPTDQDLYIAVQRALRLTLDEIESIKTSCKQDYKEKYSIRRTATDYLRLYNLYG